VITVDDAEAKIELNGAMINVSYTANTACAFALINTASVDLTLSGSNYLSSGFNRGGLEVSGENKLSINATSAGSLRATGGGDGAGIGSGYNGSGGTITINGGTVNATSVEGAGIGGGGDHGNGGTVIINGGTVNATSNGNGAGIGGGNGGGDGGKITVNGGTVTATSTNGPCDIGPGAAGLDGNIFITGGSVYTKRSGGISVSPQPKNLANPSVPVYLNKLLVGSSSNANKQLSGCVIDGVSAAYGVNDVKTDSTGYVYFWLPANAPGSVVVTADNNSAYGLGFARAADTVNDENLLLLGGNERVSGVKIKSPDLDMTVGEICQLSADITPSGAVLKVARWSSNNPTIASVDINGNVEAMSVGTATITVTTDDGGKTDTCAVTVTDPTLLHSIGSSSSCVAGAAGGAALCGAAGGLLARRRKRGTRRS